MDHCIGQSQHLLFARNYGDEDESQDIDQISNSSSSSDSNTTSTSWVKGAWLSHIKGPHHHHRHQKRTRRTSEVHTPGPFRIMRPQSYGQHASRDSAPVSPQRPSIGPQQPNTSHQSLSSLSSGSSSGSSERIVRTSRGCSELASDHNSYRGQAPSSASSATPPISSLTISAAQSPSAASSSSLPPPSAPPTKPYVQYKQLADPTKPQMPGTSGKKPRYQFYTIENLPPRDLVEYLIGGLYKSRVGLERLLCPISLGQAEEMMEKVYRAGEHGSGGGNDHGRGRLGPGTVDGRAPKNQPRSELCQVLLLAALGSQVVEGLIGDDVQMALFTSGRWYLDVPYGSHASAPDRICANMLAGLYLVLEKNIAAKEYFNIARIIAKGCGYDPRNRQSPTESSPSRALSRTLDSADKIVDSRRGSYPAVSTDSHGGQRLHPAGGTSPLKIWQSLLFLDGWVSSSVGIMPHLSKDLDSPITSSEEHYQQSVPTTTDQYISLAIAAENQYQIDASHYQQFDTRATHSPSYAPQQHQHLQQGPQQGPQQQQYGIFSLPAGHTPTGSADMDNAIHNQLASLGVLMGAILHEVVAPETVHIVTIKTYSDRLSAWHKNLPQFLTLSMAGHEAYEAPTLLIHCAYLSSIILLTSRLFVEKIASQDQGAPSGSSSVASEVEEFSTMCVKAARQLATVVGLIRENNRLTRRCWLIIQSAYTGALVICLDLCTRRGRPMLESDFNEATSLIVRCMEVLRYCSVFDPIAARNLHILEPIYKTLTTPEPTSAQRRSLNYQPPPFPTNNSLRAHLLERMRTPFGGEGSVVDHDFFAVRGNWPDGYRFLQPTGPSEQGANLKIPLTGVKGLPPVSRDGTEKNYPCRTKEEYEEFFRRTT